MNRTRSIALCSTAFLALLAILILPGAVSAAPASSNAYSTTIVDSPGQPTFAIPGVFALKFGSDISSTQLDIPALNATAAVEGLTLGPSFGFDSITLTQQQPKVSEAATISGAQVSVGGPQTGYSANATAQVELHPGPGFQAKGTVGIVYDGMSKSAGMSLQDASVTVPTSPVGVAMTGINTGQGELTIDSAQVSIPVAGSSVTVNGLHTGSSGTGWESLAVSQGPDAQIKIGNVATISGIELSVPSVGSAQPTTVAANFAFNVGQVAHAEGQVIGVRDRSGGPSGVAVKDANASVQIPGWDFQLTGINSVQGGVTVDNINFVAEPINLMAELSNVTIGAGGGVTFDQAQVTYLPNDGGQPKPGAFQMTMTKTDAGYVLTTASLLPIAAK
jgi:hypothetical protein